MACVDEDAPLCVEEELAAQQAYEEDELAAELESVLQAKETQEIPTEEKKSGDDEMGDDPDVAIEKLPVADVAMTLEDWHKMDTAEWDGVKYPHLQNLKGKHLKGFLASLPQAPPEVIPETLQVGQVAFEEGQLRIAPGHKLQGPHQPPNEGDTESPEPEKERALHYAWICTLSCPTEKTRAEKNLKKPGEFTRYHILKFVLVAVAKTNEAVTAHNHQAQTMPQLDSIAH